MNPIELDRLVEATKKPSIHMIVMNLQHAYTLFLNEQTKARRLELLNYMQGLALDLAKVVAVTNAEPEPTIYKQLEQQ